jgi:AcrR family transcriptional regulator
MALKQTTLSGHDARSAKTMERLIDAAIEVIGAVGYEGATTRELARAAGANLSAIPYHFGGKKELYLAAARKIAAYVHDRFEEVALVLRQTGEGDVAHRFEAALIHLLQIVLENAEPHAWTSFFARCIYDNDEAFAIIHDCAIAPLLDDLTRSAAAMFGRDPSDVELRLRVSAIVTAIVGFRFQRGITMRGLDWEGIEGGYATQLENMLRDLCRSDFLRAD